MPNTDTLQISPEVLTLIARIDEFKGAWRALGALAPDRLLALRRVATIESIGSSTRIEGSRLSDRDVERLLANLEIRSFATRDEQEVAGYAELMDLVFSSWRDIPFTENHIRQLHQVLLRHSEKDAWHRGGYKTNANSVAAFDEHGAQIGIVFATASPFDTPRRMAELVDWVRQALDDARLHPLLVIAICIVVFLEIHPFQDGNGRLSRALTTLLLLRAGYSHVPYSSLESVVEQSKEGYYLALRQTQGTIRSDTPDWQPWLLYFLRSLSEQVRMLERKIEREGYQQVATWLRHGHPRFRGRAIPGVRDGFAQVPEICGHAVRVLDRLLEHVDRALARSSFVAGPRLTVADIGLLVTLDFAARVGMPTRPPAAVAAWHRAMAARPSASA